MTEIIKIQNLKKKITNFRDNRVYITKKVRMNAEERMNRNNLHSIIILNIYTFILLCYSINALSSPVDKYLSIVTLIVSLAVFGVSLFVSLYGFREKALAYKMSHLELAEIETHLDILELDCHSNHKELLKLFKIYQLEYHKIMSKTDNHKKIDYIKYNHDIKKTISSQCSYWRGILLVSIARFSLYLLALLSLLYIIFKG